MARVAAQPVDRLGQRHIARHNPSGGKDLRDPDAGIQIAVAAAVFQGVDMGAVRGCHKDRRLKINQTGKRHVVIAMREREGRTQPFVGTSEGEGVALANENVSRMSTISADKASHRDELHMGWHVDRVNHSEIYSNHGKHTNMVKSFFSALMIVNFNSLRPNSCLYLLRAGMALGLPS